MDKNTLNAIQQQLPDPATYPENEYYYKANATDKINDEIIETRIVFKKDESGEKWIFIEILGKKETKD